MTGIANQDQNREPEFEPDLAYDLDSYRVNESGLVNGDDLTAEITRDLKDITPSIINNNEQVRTLRIQVNGASPEEEDGITSHIITEIQKLDPRIQDIEVRCINFQGDAQIVASLGRELGRIGLQIADNPTGLMRFKLTPYTKTIGVQIHKKEKEDLTDDEVQVIAQVAERYISNAIMSWTPGLQFTLKFLAYNTRPMHQDDVKDIVAQVFNHVLMRLTNKFSTLDPPIIPNLRMEFEFKEGKFSNEVDKFVYESPKNIANKKDNEADTN